MRFELTEETLATATPEQMRSLLRHILDMSTAKDLLSAAFCYGFDSTTGVIGHKIIGGVLHVAKFFTHDPGPPPEAPSPEALLAYRSGPKGVQPHLRPSRGRKAAFSALTLEDLGL